MTEVAEARPPPTLLKVFPYTTVGILAIVMAFRYELVEDWIRVVSEYLETERTQTIVLLAVGVVVAMVVVHMIWSAFYYYVNLQASKKAAEVLYIKERNALMAIFNAMDGKLWRDKTRWGSDEPIERWKGVKIDHTTGRVNKLLLAENNLGGMCTEYVLVLNSLHVSTLYGSDNFFRFHSGRNWGFARIEGDRFPSEQNPRYAFRHFLPYRCRKYECLTLHALILVKAVLFTNMFYMDTFIVCCRHNSRVYEDVAESGGIVFVR